MYQTLAGDQEAPSLAESYAVDYPHQSIGASLIVHADCFAWLARLPENSLHAVITDPPYGVKEYQRDQLEKRNKGQGGIWRIPPSFDGHTRAPLPRGMKVSDCLREYETGGLRRTAEDKPFSDVIPSERTPRRERSIAPHPSLKPQAFLRQLAHVALPLGTGIIADPFMGSSATVAAAEAVGVPCVGVEIAPEYYAMSQVAIPKLAALDLTEVSKAHTQARIIHLNMRY